MRSSVLLLPLVALLISPFLDGCGTGAFQRNHSAAVSMEKEGAVEKEMIRVERPQAGAVIHSPLMVRGEARGPWYFEGNFPLMLRDNGGNILARGVARAKGEWMTTDFVAFVGRLEFTAPKGRFGELVLQKDNPSGRTELDDSLIIPVQFW